METIKPGNKSQAKDPFWTGQTIECPKCDAAFKLKATDKPAHSALCPGKTCFYCATPGCGTLIPVEPQRA